MVVITRRVAERRERVSFHICHSLGRQLATQCIDIIFIRAELILIVVRQSIEAHILTFASTFRGIESIRQRRLLRYTAPNSLNHIREIVVNRQSVFIRLHAILEYVLANLAEIEIQVTTLGIVILHVEERAEKPELYILNVRLFKVRVVHLAHYATPPTFGEQEPAIVGNVINIEVIWTSLFRIEREVESLNCRRFSVIDFLCGINFARSDFTDIRVRLLVKVVT